QPAENGHVGGIGVAGNEAGTQIEEKAPDALAMDAVVSAVLLCVGQLALQGEHDRVAAGSLGHQFADQRVEVIPAHHVIPLNYAAFARKLAAASVSVQLACAVTGFG